MFAGDPRFRDSLARVRIIRIRDILVSPFDHLPHAGYSLIGNIPFAELLTTPEMSPNGYQTGISGTGSGNRIYRRIGHLCAWALSCPAVPACRPRVLSVGCLCADRALRNPSRESM